MYASGGQVSGAGQFLVEGKVWPLSGMHQALVHIALWAIDLDEHGADLSADEAKAFADVLFDILTRHRLLKSSTHKPLRDLAYRAESGPIRLEYRSAL